MQVLRARLFDLERQKQAERARRRAQGPGRLAATARSASAPTIFRKARVTDHRINLTLYKLDKVLDGEALDEVVDALIADDQARKLSEFEDELRDDLWRGAWRGARRRLPRRHRERRARRAAAARRGAPASTWRR